MIEGTRLSRRRFAAASIASLLEGRTAKAEERRIQLVVKQVAPGVFVHAPPVGLISPSNRGDIANLGFIVGAEAVAVIDTGSSISIGDALLAAIRGVTDKPVRFVVNTHMHFDHLMGNAAFAATGATFIAHKNLPRSLAARREAYVALLKRELGEDALPGGDMIVPELLVDDETVLDLGRRQLTLKAWPTAHTDNDLSVFDSESGTLFAGDLLFNAHTPVIDGSLVGWLKVIAELKTIPAKQVVPGHGAAILPWPTALAAQERYLERLAADIRGAVKEGVPIDQAVKSAGQSERNNWQLFDDFNPRNATAAYGELEWE